MIAFQRRELKQIQEKVLNYLKLQRFEAAEDLLQSAMNEYGSLSNLLNLMGVVYHSRSQFAQALEYFERAHTANPEYLEASLNLALTLTDLGFYEQAERFFNANLPTRPEEPKVPSLILGRIANLHCQTGKAYEEAGLLQEAYSQYNTALELYPSMPDIRLGIAKLCLRTGLLQQAEEHLQVLIDEESQTTEALNLLGVIYRQRGDTDRARSCWQRVQSSNTQDTISKAYLVSLAPSPRHP